MMTLDDTPTDKTLILDDVSLVRSGNAILSSIDWQVATDERWIVMGANGSGKTSLIRIASLYEHPSSGRVVVAGGELGTADIRELRRRIALVSPALIDMIRPGLSCRDIVMSAKFAALEPWWHQYEPADATRARDLLDAQGIASMADRAFATLSSGQKQRVMLARALMGSPELVLLDEPCNGLDLRAREELLAALTTMADYASSPATVVVTHHVEEIPVGFTHLLAIRDGHIVARGALTDTLTDETLSETFGLTVRLTRHEDGRFSARAV